MITLHWPGKEKETLIQDCELKEISRYGKLEPYQDNFLVHGDNLPILKYLENDYTGKVKCIYIDPPYNSKSAFMTYTNEKDDSENNYHDNLEHSKWLNLMKERLVILHRLLRKNGSLWISIDTTESHYLKVLCDEIFGRRNFVDEIVWERSYAPINLKKTLSRSHDYILVYAKEIEGFELNKLPRSVEANARYSNRDNDSRGPWKSDNLSVGPEIQNKVYPIKTPSGRIVLPPKGRCWLLTNNRLQEYIKDNRIWFGEDGNNVPSLKRFLSEVKDGITAMTLWKRDDVGDTQEAKRESKTLNSENVFPTPKPERLIYRILQLATNSSDLVLDSFAGSGTTGAVAHKMGRRWIMIEMNGPCHTHILPRLQKVIDGNDKGGITTAVNWKGGGGFVLFKAVYNDS